MEKLIIEARVNEFMMREEGNPNVPYTPHEIAADAVKCREAGAAILHFHARRPDGAPDHDAETYAETVGRILAASDILVHPTLGYATLDAGPEARLAHILKMAADPKRSDMNYISTGGGDDSGPGLTVQGLPLVKPPWGRITAIDLNKGEIAWQIAHGETPDTVKNHPALKGLNIPRTGRPGGAGGSSGGIGTLTTKTLVIAGEGGAFTTPNGQRGAMLRAYDKATGREVGAVYMPGAQTGSPMTYMLNGRQYIVLGVSGAIMPGELIAYALPSVR